MNNRYATLSKKYLTEAKKCLKEGNYLQASEKYWLSAAQIVKAYAHKKEWAHDGHAKLFRIIDKITEITKDEEVDILFGIANELHINSYENWLTKRQIKRKAKRVEEFIEKINAIL